MKIKSKISWSAPLALGTVLLLGSTFVPMVYGQSTTNNNGSDQNVSGDQDEMTTSGVVVSVTRNTIVLRVDNGDYRLFTLDRNTIRPRTIAAGSRVRVRSTAGDEAGYRVATEVSGATAGAAGASSTAGPIPPSVSRLERQIERNARLYHFGVRAGVALDPELISIGIQAQVGPVFSRTISFRPSVEFAYGEVTSLFAINPEFLYRLPVSSRDGRWTAYTGAGPGFTFLEQNFNHTTGSGKRIDFGEFHSSTGLNILGGIQYRSGVFTELKTSVYAEPAPTLRLIIGYNF